MWGKFLSSFIHASIKKPGILLCTVTIDHVLHTTIPGKESGETKYLEDSKELKVAVDKHNSTRKQSQITVLLLFCKNPEINKHIKSVKIPEPDIRN